MNDIVLFLSLLYLSIDIWFEWEGFSGCYHPIHRWALVSYGLIVISRLVYMFGSFLSVREPGDFLMNVREKSLVLRCLMSLTWLVLVPLVAAWSLFGTVWIIQVRRHTPTCLPNGMHLWFLVIWQVMSYFWILIHCGLGGMAWLLEKRLRYVERNLQEIEDDDLQLRWGQISRVYRHTSLNSMSGTGLTPREISCLPLVHLPEGSPGETSEQECPICLEGLKPEDAVRPLAACSHTFHRPCIDLWLLQRAECPLCKRKVQVDGEEAVHAKVD